MALDELLDRFERAVTLESEDAAIRIDAAYEPQGGPDTKVFPPTYLESNGTRYHMEERWDREGNKTTIVVLDSLQSQANRAEQALGAEAKSLGLPQMVLLAELADRTVRISSLDAPHRSRDAYFIDSELNGRPFDQTEVGQALNTVSLGHATPALRYAPYDLVYGVWDSHRGRRLPVKFPRVYTSEMLGWDVVRGQRAATKGDPLNLPAKTTVATTEWRPDMVTRQKKKSDVKLSELGHGMVPGQADDRAGGVSVRAITRQAVLSLTGLARLNFPTSNGDATRAGRAALAALALLGDRLAFDQAGLNLRSGADLVLMSDNVQWIRRRGVAEPLKLTVDDARALLARARERLARFGVEWDGDPIVVRPTPRLLKVIEQTFYVPELDAQE